MCLPVHPLVYYDLALINLYFLNHGKTMKFPFLNYKLALQESC